MISKYSCDLENSPKIINGVGHHDSLSVVSQTYRIQSIDSTKLATSLQTQKYYKTQIQELQILIYTH